MAGAVQFDVVIAGRGGHAAMPHLTHDPVVAAAAIVGALQASPSSLAGLAGWLPGCACAPTVCRPAAAHLLGTLPARPSCLPLTVPCPAACLPSLPCSQALVSRETSPFDSAVVSVTRISGGEAYNVLPDSGGWEPGTELHCWWQAGDGGQFKC